MKVGFVVLALDLPAQNSAYLQQILKRIQVFLLCKYIRQRRVAMLHGSLFARSCCSGLIHEINPMGYLRKEN
jgi:hypothetical protein